MTRYSVLCENEDLIHVNLSGMAIGEETSTGTRTGTTIDHHHPFYLQPCDTPGSSLISIELTGTDYYALWSNENRLDWQE